MTAPQAEHIVFLPGLDGTGLSFEPLCQLLPTDLKCTVIRYPYRKLTFEETVACAAEQFPVDGGSIVVAESFSGPVAVELVASGRIKAKGLVLAATFARSPRPLLLPLARCLRLEFLLKAGFPGILLEYILGGKDFARKLMPFWKKVHAAVPPSVLVHRLKVISMVDVRHRLPKVTIPCCYIQAIDDVVVPSTALADFVAAMPNLVVKRVAGPHFVLEAQPAASMTIIGEFMTAISDGAAC